MKRLLYLLLVVSVAACNNAAKTDEVPPPIDSATTKTNPDSVANYIHTFNDTALENKITAALLKLPFVIKSNNYIDSFSNHKHSIAFMMDAPAANETDIQVQAGYNGDERFETYYRFFVDPKTLEIKVYDPVQDKKLSLKAFLNTQQ
ncbi:MAG: hypothetical protein ABI685_08530 [Ferruginibacter sp.]